MAYVDKNKIDLQIINRVLPEYEPISKGPALGNIEYKSIDSRTGDIYLIQHPDFWDVTKRDTKGHSYRVKLEPKLMMTYDEAKAAAVGMTASQIRSSKKPTKNFF